MDWHQIFATRMDRMKASEIRELLKLLDQPDIISFAGGIPDPELFPTEAFQSALADALSPANASAALQYSVSEGYAPCGTGSRPRWQSWARLAPARTF